MAVPKRINGLDLKMYFIGDMKGLHHTFEWWMNDSQKELDKSLRANSKVLRDLMKFELQNKSNFVPLAPFTLAVRRALGISSSSPGIASGLMRNSISSHWEGSANYFVGLKKGKGKYALSKGDIASAAVVFELGRKPFVLDLDKVGPRGKTPRQWFWWLYFQGVIKNPPRRSARYYRMSGSIERPFAEITQMKYHQKIAEKIALDLHDAWFNAVMNKYPISAPINVVDF